jgi:hypothetical protein
MVYKGEKEKLFLVLSLVVSKVQVTQCHAIGRGMLIDHVTASEVSDRGGVRNKGNISVILL